MSIPTRAPNSDESAISPTTTPIIPTRFGSMKLTTFEATEIRILSRAFLRPEGEYRSMHTYGTTYQITGRSGLKSISLEGAHHTEATQPLDSWGSWPPGPRHGPPLSIRTLGRSFSSRHRPSPGQPFRSPWNRVRALSRPLPYPGPTPSMFIRVILRMLRRSRHCRRPPCRCPRNTRHGHGTTRVWPAPG